MKMNQKKIINSKQPQSLAAVYIVVSLVTAMMIGINNSQNLQKAMAEEVYSPGTNITTETADEYNNTASANSGVEVKAVNPDQTNQQGVLDKYSTP
jgi:hypothetical protein